MKEKKYADEHMNSHSNGNVASCKKILKKNVINIGRKHMVNTGNGRTK